MILRMNFNFEPKSLAELTPGEVGRVVNVLGPARRMRLRLRTLGIRPGATVRLLRRGPGGPLLVEIDGCRLALGWAVARRILVLPASPEPEE